MPYANELHFLITQKMFCQVWQKLVKTLVKCTYEELHINPLKTFSSGQNQLTFAFLGAMIAIKMVHFTRDVNESWGKVKVKRCIKVEVKSELLRSLNNFNLESKPFSAWRPRLIRLIHAAFLPALVNIQFYVPIYVILYSFISINY